MAARIFVALALALPVSASAFVQAPAPASTVLPGLGRAELMREDLSIAGHKAIMIRVDFPPGASAARHNHPGEELVYVIQGELEYRLDGRPPVTLKGGDVLFIPDGVVHAVRNVGSGVGAELGTYIVDKDKPLVVLAD